MRNFRLLWGIIFSGLAILGGVLSRWHGGGFFKAPKMLKSFLYSLPFGILTGLALYFEKFTAIKMSWPIYDLIIIFNHNLLMVISHETIINLICGTVGFLVIVFTMVFKNTGHGGFMDWGTWLLARGKEKLEIFISWLRGKISERLYDTIGLAIIGGFRNLPAYIAFAQISPAGALPCLLCGIISMPISYALGWKNSAFIAKSSNKDFDEPTEIGEFGSGYIAIAGAIISFILIIGGLNV